MAYKLRWTNETGGDWLHDGATYADLDLCELTAQMAFDDGYVDGDDIIQAWEVDEEGEPTNHTATAEWDREDFS